MTRLVSTVTWFLPSFCYIMEGTSGRSWCLQITGWGKEERQGGEASGEVIIIKHHFRSVVCLWCFLTMLRAYSSSYSSTSYRLVRSLPMLSMELPRMLPFGPLLVGFALWLGADSLRAADFSMALPLLFFLTMELLVEFLRDYPLSSMSANKSLDLVEGMS